MGLVEVSNVLRAVGAGRWYGGRGSVNQDASACLKPECRPDLQLQD